MAGVDALTPGARMLWDKGMEVPGRFGHQETGLHHLLLALLERHGPMAESVASGLNANNYRRQLESHLKEGRIGDPVEPDELLNEALERARQANKAEVSERYLAATLLARAGWTLLTPVEPVPSPLPAQEVISKQGAPPEMARAKAAEQTDYHPRARHPTPLLEEFGRDLCQEALDGKLPTILGREVELQATMETLCRWTKRNPLLVGPAGVGKTAIVEGLAQRIVRQAVPPPIRGMRIFSLQASALVSGTGVVGRLEERMHKIIDEASQDGIVLFIDEVHSIVGSGGMRQTSDVGSLLKPALAKGEIACIGATTDAEFRTFIEQDRALERRFQPLRVQELSEDATLAILRTLADRAKREREVTITEEALQSIILLARRYLRNRYFPDKAIDILEQCAAHALLNELHEVDVSVVRDVAERMVGLPVDLGAALSERLAELKQHLMTEAFCPDDPADELCQRLEITMRGLDVAPLRPNAVLLVAATAGQMPELAAHVLARTLYGSADRLIEVDMTRFTHPADVNWLTGSPPGYIGHDNPVQFQLELAQRPWSIVLFKTIEASHPQAQEFMAQALRSGFFTDAQGRRIYLSDAIAVLTMTTEEREGGGPLGFLVSREGDEEPTSDAELYARSLLIPELVAELDVSWRPQAPTMERVQAWVKEWILPSVSERYKHQGVEIEWDDSLLTWVSDAVLDNGDLMLGERLFEAQVLPALIPYLGAPAKLTLSYEEHVGVQVQHTKGVQDELRIEGA